MSAARGSGACWVAGVRGAVGLPAAAAHPRARVGLRPSRGSNGAVHSPALIPFFVLFAHVKESSDRVWNVWSDPARGGPPSVLFIRFASARTRRPAQGRIAARHSLTVTVILRISPP